MVQVLAHGQPGALPVVDHQHEQQHLQHNHREPAPNFSAQQRGGVGQQDKIIHQQQQLIQQQQQQIQSLQKQQLQQALQIQQQQQQIMHLHQLLENLQDQHSMLMPRHPTEQESQPPRQEHQASEHQHSTQNPHRELNSSRQRPDRSSDWDSQPGLPAPTDTHDFKALRLLAQSLQASELGDSQRGNSGRSSAAPSRSSSHSGDQSSSFQGGKVDDAQSEPQASSSVSAWPMPVKMRQQSFGGTFDPSTEEEKLVLHNIELAAQEVPSTSPEKGSFFSGPASKVDSEWLGEAPHKLLVRQGSHALGAEAALQDTPYTREVHRQNSRRGSSREEGSRGSSPEHQKSRDRSSEGRSDRHQRQSGSFHGSHHGSRSSSRSVSRSGSRPQTRENSPDHSRLGSRSTSAGEGDSGVRRSSGTEHDRLHGRAGTMPGLGVRSVTADSSASSTGRAMSWIEEQAAIARGSLERLH